MAGEPAATVAAAATPGAGLLLLAAPASTLPGRDVVRRDAFIKSVHGRNDETRRHGARNTEQDHQTSVPSSMPPASGLGAAPTGELELRCRTGAASGRAGDVRG